MAISIKQNKNINTVSIKATDTIDIKNIKNNDNTDIIEFVRHYMTDEEATIHRLRYGEDPKITMREETYVCVNGVLKTRYILTNFERNDD